MSRWTQALSLSGLGFLLALAGCSKPEHDVEERYFLVCSNAKIPYWQAAQAGLHRAASQLKVRAEMIGPDTYDPKAQQQEFRNALRHKPTGILISPADAELLKADIDGVIGQGIPVITMDSDSPTSQRLLYIGTNNYQAGVMGGKKLVEHLQGKGNVIVFTMPGQSNLRERLNGYQAVLAEHPKIKIVEIVDIKGDPGIAFDKTMDVVEHQLDKIDAFVCLEANAGKDVAEVLNRKGIKNKVIVAMDTDEPTLKWVQQGLIAATIAQKPFTMAYYGLKMLDDLYHHKLPSLTRNWAQDPFSLLPTIVDTGAAVVDRSNVGDFIKAQGTNAAEPPKS